MYVLLIGNVLLVEMIDVDLLLPVCRPQLLQKVALELAAEVVDVLAGILTDEEHLPDMGFGLAMAFEAILIPALFLAYLAVLRWKLAMAPRGKVNSAYPSQPLKSFRFKFVVEVFGASYFSTRHLYVRRRMWFSL